MSVPNYTVSIAIPCYNSAAYVSGAIRSAIEQTYAALEIIVVDDGSTDRSLEVMHGFGDRVVIVAGKHRGAAAARNLAMGMARGDLVKFLDADDELVPDALARQVAQYAALNSSRAIVFGDWIDLADGTFHSVQKMLPKAENLAGPEFILKSTIQTSLSLYPREALLRCSGFNERLKNSNEYEMNFRLALLGCEFVHRVGVISKIRRHSGQSRIAVRYSPSNYPLGAILVARELDASIASAGLDRFLANRLRVVVAERVIHFGADHFLRGRWLLSFRHLEYVFRQDWSWLVRPARLWRLMRMFLARLHFMIVSRRVATIGGRATD